MCGAGMKRYGNHSSKGERRLDPCRGIIIGVLSGLFHFISGVPLVVEYSK